MPQPELIVEIKITPHPEGLSAEKLDELINGELVAFERWFLEHQRRRGNQNPTSLLNYEKAILQTFVLYLTTKEKA